MRYVLYHAHCNDGFGAAFAIWKKYKEIDTKYIPVTYQKPPPSMPNATEVYIVDFSYPRDVILELRNKIEKVFIIDHHTTAEKALHGLDDCLFDMNYSGAVLTWKYFHPNLPIPELFLYIQDRDLWIKELPQTDEIFFALISYPYNFELWDSFNLDTLKIEGKAIRRKLELETQYLASQAREMRFLDYSIRIVNSPVLQSEIAHLMLEQYPEISFAACYHHTQAGKTKFSLRTKEDRNTNVASIANLFGGGGHAYAAGFEIPTLNNPEDYINPKVSREITLQFCGLLNELLKIDNNLIEQLIRYGIVCNEYYANHPHVVVRENTNKETELSTLGLLNGLLTKIKQCKIAANYDNDNRLIGFVPYEEI